MKLSNFVLLVVTCSLTLMVLARPLDSRPTVGEAFDDFYGKANFDIGAENLGHHVGKLYGSMMESRKSQSQITKPGRFHDASADAGIMCYWAAVTSNAYCIVSVKPSLVRMNPNPMVFDGVVYLVSSSNIVYATYRFPSEFRPVEVNTRACQAHASAGHRILLTFAPDNLDMERAGPLDVYPPYELSDWYTLPKPGHLINCSRPGKGSEY